MWALVESGSVTKVYTRPKAITVGDVNYPANIFMLWSAVELKAIGIYEVIINNTKYKDPEYYTNTDQSFNFAANKVTASYGTATAKPLADSTDSGGNVIRGLKYTHSQTIDNQSYSLLEPSDWRVVKAQETSGTVASDWTTYREAVRTTAQSMKTKINAVSTVTALMALYVYNDATPPVRPLGEFPIAPE